MPAFRTCVFYVPQRPALLTGTPRDFLKTITSFRSRNSGSKSAADNFTYPFEVSKAWGIDEELWDRNWSNLSGGESQRIALATAIGLNTAEILLLDGKNVFPLCPSVLTLSFLEPTSALDHLSTNLVEEFILHELRSSESELKAIVWITHSEEQARRVGTRFIRISPSGCEEEPRLPEP